MIRKILKIPSPILALVLLLPLALTACETPVQVQKLPDLTFAHLAPINLNVARIEVVSRYQPPVKAPNVDHLFPTPPVKAMRQWAKDRLRAVGKDGLARLVITDASAVETSLQKKSGSTAAFTKQQSQRYDLSVQARLEVSNRSGSGNASAHAKRFSTIGEDSSINTREKLWFDLTEALVRDFDATMEKNIRQHLGAWIR